MSWNRSTRGMLQHSSEVPKHLSREASAHLAPLLLSRFHAEGRVLLCVLHVCWSLTSSWLFGYKFSFNFTRLAFRS